MVYKLSKITEIYISLTTLYSEQNWIFSRTLKVGYYQKVLEIKIQLLEAAKSHVRVSNSKPSVLNLLNWPEWSRAKRRNAENKMNKSLSLNSELELLTIRQLIVDKLVFSLNAGFYACRWRKTRDLIRSRRMPDGLFHKCKSMLKEDLYFNDVRIKLFFSIPAWNSDLLSFQMRP